MEGGGELVQAGLMKKKKKCGTHLVGEGLDVCGDSDIAGLDGDLLDA